MGIYSVVFGVLLSFIVLGPLAIKWELDRCISFVSIAVIGTLSGAVLWGINSKIALDVFQLFLIGIVVVISLAATSLLYRFYRDPERSITIDEKSILSPADGIVKYIKKIEEGEIPVSEKMGKRYSVEEFTQTEDLSGSGYIVGISMSFLDVHVNRAPLCGEIETVEQIRGTFSSLKNLEALFLNERAVIVLKNSEFRLGIVEIASRLVRSIVPFVKAGQLVQQGERISMIRFGSQVDLIIPCIPSLVMNVSVGETVKAGLSIIAFKE
jgi:phosphatidylserine decarboxylase